MCYKKKSYKVLVIAWRLKRWGENIRLRKKKTEYQVNRYYRNNYVSKHCEQRPKTLNGILMAFFLLSSKIKEF